MAISIADVVRVTARVVAGSTIRREFGRSLFVGISDVLWATGSGKVETFSDLAGVAKRFASSTEEYMAAVAYFSQVPRPRNLSIARWAYQDSDTILTSGSAIGTIQNIAAVSDGSVIIGGVEVDGIDFSGNTDYATIAATLQVAFRAEADARFKATLTVVYTGGRFAVDFDGAADLGGAAEAGTAGTDVSALLALTVGTGAAYVQGGTAETITDGLIAVAELEDSFYFVGVDKAYHGTDTMTELTRWCQANGRMAVASSAENAALTTAEEASVAAQISALGQQRVIGTFSTSADYKSMSVAGRLGSIDFRLPGSFTTLNLRELPGFAGDVLTETQQRELRRKRWNYYVPAYDGNAYARGFTTNPKVWADTQYWLDWLVGAIQVKVWNLLRNSNAVPQNQSGALAVRNTIANVLELGILNGGLTPGKVSEGFAREIRDSVGEDFDGVLSTGYLIWTGTPAERSLPVKVWMKGAGAIHEVSIDLTVEN